MLIIVIKGALQPTEQIQAHQKQSYLLPAVVSCCSITYRKKMDLLKISCYSSKFSFLINIALMKEQHDQAVALLPHIPLGGQTCIFSRTTEK